MSLRIWSRRDLVCREAVELVSDYLEGVLSGAQRRRLEAHLAQCPNCPEYLAQIRAVITLAGSVTPEDLTPHARSEFIRLYKRWRPEGALDAEA